MNILTTSTPTTCVSFVSISSVSDMDSNTNTKTKIYPSLRTRKSTNINISTITNTNKDKITNTHTYSSPDTKTTVKTSTNVNTSINTSINTNIKLKFNGSNSNSRLTSSRQNSQSSLSSNFTSTSPSLRSAYQVKRATALKKSFSSIRSLSSSSDDKDLLFDRSTSFLSHRSSIFSLSSNLEPIAKHPLTNLESEFAIDDDDYNDISNKLENNELNLNSNLGIIANLTDPKFTETSNNHKNITSLLNFFKKMVSQNSRPCIRRLKVNREVTPIKACSQDVPLETFSQEFNTILLNNQPLILPTNINVNEDYNRFLSLSLNGKTRRFREIRINPKYLLIYAIDSSARSKGFLQISEHELDIFEEHLFEQQQSNNFDHEQLEWELLTQFQKFTNVDNNYIADLKLASLSRYKLWTTITLPPRKDPVPDYKKLVDDIAPVAGLDFCEVPWSNLKDFKQGKSRNKLQKPAGLLMNSNIQYVSKNCVSKRWVSWS